MQDRVFKNRLQLLVESLNSDVTILPVYAVAMFGDPVALFLDFPAQSNIGISQSSDVRFNCSDGKFFNKLFLRVSNYCCCSIVITFTIGPKTYKSKYHK